MSISFSGLASGLDTSSWIESLTALKQAKVTKLTQERQDVLLSKNTLSSIKSFFTSFRSLIERVTDTRFNIVSMDLFAQNIATSADTKVLTAKATSEAEEGTYEITVDKLASNSKAVSKYSYTTTRVETSVATQNSYLKDLGVTAGDISINVNGEDKTIEITESDTIKTFIKKLKDAGVTANYNSNTGIFSMNVNSAAITDTDNTGIVDSLHLNGVNNGFISGNLTTEKVDPAFEVATLDTLLKDLGVNAGTIVVEANDAVYNVVLEDDDKISDLLTALQSEGIDADFSNGVFTLNNALITSEGATNIISAFGLSETVSSKTQTSSALTTTTETEYQTVITADTLLGDINPDVEASGNIILRDVNSMVTKTIEVDSTTTMGDLIDAINNSGLDVTATLKADGTFEMSGEYVQIAGGTYDVTTALGLTQSVQNSSFLITGTNTLAAVTTSTTAGMSTTLASLGLTDGGTLEVTKGDGSVTTLTFSGTDSLEDIKTSLATQSITMSMTDGVLSFENSNSAKYNRITGGTVAEAFGINPEAISTAVSYRQSSTSALICNTTMTATVATTLAQLGYSDGLSVEISDSSGNYVTSTTIASSTSIEGIFGILSGHGITGVIDSAGVMSFTTTGNYISGGTFATEFGITSSSYSGQTITIGTTMTSSSPVTYNSLTAITTSTKLSDFLDLSDAVITVYTNNADGSKTPNSQSLNEFFIPDNVFGFATSLNEATVGDLQALLTIVGMTFSLSPSGVITLEGSTDVDEAAAVAGSIFTQMGINLTSTTQSTTLGVALTVSERKTYTTQVVATESTKLSDLVDISDGDVIINYSDSSTAFFGNILDAILESDYITASTAEDITIGDLSNFLSTEYEIDFELSETGVASISGGTVDGPLFEQMGITLSTSTTSYTVGYSKTISEALTYTAQAYATMDSKISDYYADFASSSTNRMIDIHDYTDLNTQSPGSKTITLDADATFADMATALSAHSITMTMTDGVISLDNSGTDGRVTVASPTLLQALGMSSNQVTNVTTTVARSVSSDAPPQCRKAVTGSTTLGEVLGGELSDTTFIFYGDWDLEDIALEYGHSTYKELTIDEFTEFLQIQDPTGELYFDTTTHAFRNLDNPCSGGLEGEIFDILGVYMDPNTAEVRTTELYYGMGIVTEDTTLGEFLDMRDTALTIDGTNYDLEVWARETLGKSASDMTIREFYYDFLYVEEAFQPSFDSYTGIIYDFVPSSYTELSGSIFEQMGVAGTGISETKPLRYFTPQDVDFNTTLGALGLKEDTEIITSSGSIAVTASTTLSDLDSMLQESNIGWITIDGDVYFDTDSTMGGYIVDSNGVLELLNIMDTPHVVNYDRQYSISDSNTLAKTETYTLTSDTTSNASLSNYGIVAGDTFVFANQGGALTTYTVDSTLASGSLYDLMQKFYNSYGIETYVNSSGQLTLTSTGNYKLVDGTGTTKLGFSGTEAVTSETYSYYNTESNTLQESITTVLSGSTKLADVGIDPVVDTVKFANVSTGEVTEVTLGNAMIDFTFDQAFNILNMVYGINATYNDGVMTLTSSGEYALIGGTFVDKLGITGTQNVTKETVSYTNSSSNTLTTSKTVTATASTTIGQLGWSDGSIEYYQDGERKVFSLYGTDTIETTLGKFIAAGFSAAFQDGIVTIGGAKDLYLTGTGFASLRQKFNFTGDNYSSSVLTGYQNSNSEAITKGTVTTATTSTRLGDIDGFTEGALKINCVDGSVYTLTSNASSTIADVVSELNAKGVSASFLSGLLSLTYDSNASLTGFDTLFNLDSRTAIAGNEYETSDSNQLLVEGFGIPTLDTKLGDLRNSEGKSIGDYADGCTGYELDYAAVYTTVFNAENTLGDVIAWMENHVDGVTLNADGTISYVRASNSGNGFNETACLSPLGEFLFGSSVNSTQVAENEFKYSSEALTETKTGTVTVAASDTTLLKDLGITAGEYYAYKNGVKTTLSIDEGDTIGDLRSTLADFTISSELIETPDGTMLVLTGAGNSYLETSSAANASNIVEKLFANTSEATNNYVSGTLGIDATESVVTTVTEDTLLRDLDKVSGSTTLKSEGTLVFDVNGENKTIEITSTDTVGDFIVKLNGIGLTGEINNGVSQINGWGQSVSVVEDLSSSNVMSNLGLNYSDNLGDYVVSSEVCEQSVEVGYTREGSVANYADYDTQMKLLNITSGSFSVYRDGEKATIQIDAEKTFTDLRAKVASAFGDVDVTFEDGYLKIFSTTEGVVVEAGANTDTSNISAISGFTKQNGAVKSSREMYQVNGNTVLTESGVFRLADITEGTFIIGDATFEITSTTTLNNIIAQINSSEGANATAYWDSVDGKFVIKSRVAGGALINIEAGSSNFTDVMGFTTTTRDASGNIESTALNISAQEVGENAEFTINGTEYVSTSNTVTSDISRIKGVTIDLKSLSNGETVTLKIEKDGETLSNAVSEIVDAYNELIKNVDKQIAKDAPLAGESTLKMIRNQIRSLMTSSFASAGTFKNLDSIGISLDAATAGDISTSNIDVLSFDKEKFLQAFETDRNALKELLVGSNSNGILSRVEAVVEQASSGVYGYFDSAERSYNAQIQRYDARIQSATAMVERYRERLQSKFSSMDLLISKMQNQYSSFLGT